MKIRGAECRIAAVFAALAWVLVACCSCGGGREGLYVCGAGADCVGMEAVEGGGEGLDVGVKEGGRVNLVVVVHGWYERGKWAEEFAEDIKRKAVGEGWVCGWYDWRRKSHVVNPATAARYARDTAGPELGREIAAMSKDWGHVHLIGHSCAAWLITEAAKVVAKETKADIHLTFLDAYVPVFWDEKELGNIEPAAGTIYAADHYFNRDLTLGSTQVELTHAHNVDITAADFGLRDHFYPRDWYAATVTGGFARGRCRGKRVYDLGKDGVRYGFALSMEGGTEKWAPAVLLETGNKAVNVVRGDE